MSYNDVAFGDIEHPNKIIENPRNFKGSCNSRIKRDRDYTIQNEKWPPGSQLSIGRNILRKLPCWLENYCLAIALGNIGYHP